MAIRIDRAVAIVLWWRALSEGLMLAGEDALTVRSSRVPRWRLRRPSMMVPPPATYWNPQPQHLQQPEA